MTAERPNPNETRFPSYRSMRPSHREIDSLPKPRERKIWIAEPKWDGIGVSVEISPGLVQIFTDSGKRGSSRRNVTSHFPELIDGLSLIKHSVKLHGEIISGSGTTLQERQRAITRSTSKPPVFLPKEREFSLMVFDITFLNGGGLRDRVLMERKRQLAKVVPRSLAALGIIRNVYTRRLQRMLTEAIAYKMEGIVLKRIDSKYTPGESPNWLKLKPKPEGQTSSTT